LPGSESLRESRMRETCTSGLTRGEGVVPPHRSLSYSTATRVLLDPDVRKAFRSERAVNDAFDLVIELRKVGSYKQA